MPDPKRDVERLIEDGLIRYGGGDLAGALSAWERALIQDPGNLQAIGYVDYVRQVFEQLNRPTRDELVVPFGLGHGDAPDYQIEISPEPPDDDAVSPSGKLQDGWPISSDDERETIERLYAQGEPPGTLDLELDEPAGIETLSGRMLEEAAARDELTPVHGTEVPTAIGGVIPVAPVAPAPVASVTPPPLPPRARRESHAANAIAEALRATSDSDAFDGPEQEMTPGFLDAASSTPGFEEDQAEPTPGFSDASANSTDLKRPDLGFVKPRLANTVRRRPSEAPPVGGAERNSRGTEPPPAGQPAVGEGASTGVPQPFAEGVRDPARPTRDLERESSRDLREATREAREASRDSLREHRETSRDASRDAALDAPTQPRASRPRLPSSESRSSKPSIPMPAERQSRPALAASLPPRRSSPSFPPSVPGLPPLPGLSGPSPAIPIEPADPSDSDSGALSASEREPTRPRRAVSALLAMSGVDTAQPVATRSSAGLLDPWSQLAEGNSSGGEEYANLEMAPFIEELPPAPESSEVEARSGGAGVRPETMTRDLGLAGRYKPREDLKFGEESPTRELQRPGTEDEEKTQAWATPPGAPIPTDALEVLAAQIAPRLEREVPPGETKDDRLRRRISTLVEVANEYSRLGDTRRAVAAADLALGEDPDSALAQKLIHRNRDAIQTIFQGYLGSLERRPSLARSLDALGGSPIGARAAFLLSRVDGHLTYDEILDVSGMPRLEAYRYLCQLLIRGILTVE